MSPTENRNWYIQFAHFERELGATVAAGPFQFGETAAGEATASPSDLGGLAGVFGKFVRLMRRKQGLTVEALAANADVEIAELVGIEDGMTEQPEPRTVYQLAHFFKVPEKGLLQIAGLTTARNDALVEEGVRFAARSNPINQLTAEERSALEAFVAVLNKQR